MGDKFERDYEALTGSKLAEPQNEEDVEKILSFLRMRNGFLDAQDRAELQKSSVGMQQRLLFHAENSREVLASYTTAISSQLYSDPFHFLYEVIQNADDADYNTADSKKEIPSLKFTVRERELVIDLNEDGFKLANVIAICSTGQSSKKNNATTTGEKGFGFKSVFGIASKVHIQSGVWSFSLHHQRHEDGIGMISPSRNDRQILPVGVQTRFTLTYSFHDGTDIQGLCAHIKEQPVTVLNFLRRIKKIDFAFEISSSCNESIVFEKLPQESSGGHRLEESRNGNKQMRYFRGWLREVKDMPARFGRSDSTSRVHIHLPVKDHETSQPLLDSAGQHVFAFLPVNKIPSLPFIIQADFMLPASRQDVIDNAWNRKLRENIVKLFADCVLHYAQATGHNLQYSWLRFLPRGRMSGFWVDFPTMVVEELKNTKAFLSMTNSLHYPHQLRAVPDRFLHKGDALLPNKSNSYFFLATGYASEDSLLLKDLGIQTLTSEEMLEAVVADGNSTPSRLHSTVLNDAWQDQHAMLLKSFLTGPFKVTNAAKRLRGTNIFPLRRGVNLEWGNIISSPVYLPEVLDERSGDTKVQMYMPTDLGILVIHPDAVASASRKEIYTLLGLQTCSGTKICDAIESSHQKGGTKIVGNLQAHLELLFWFNYERTAKLYAKSEGAVYTRTSDLFFQSKKEFDAEQVVGLRRTDEKQENLLYEGHQNSQMRSFVRDGKTWMQWLEAVAKIRWYPCLQEPVSQGSLHWAIEAILKESPHNFVPLLQAHWAQEYAETCRFNGKIREAILDAKVPCLGGDRLKLRDTFFPTDDILDWARKYHVDKSIGILDLPQASQGLQLEDWACLRELGIKSTAKLEFFKKILTKLAESATITPDKSLMADLYRSISSLANFQDQETLQKLFAQQKLVWDPSRSAWMSIHECVWSSKFPLSRKSVVTTSYDPAPVGNLFQTLLNLTDSKITDYLDEIEVIRVSRSSEPFHQMFSTMTKLYEVLCEIASSLEARQQIRSAFKDQQLIFYKGSWLKTSGCVWHESVSAGGHTPIKEMYPDLQQFFVSLLNVSTVSDVFMMKQLAGAAKRTDKNPSELKKLMLDTSILLVADSATESFSESIEVLQKSQFLPCRLPSGQIKCLAITEEFLIPDETMSAQAFRDQVCMLDVTYAELSSLHKLLSLLNIQHKYLSRNISSRVEKGISLPDECLTQWFRECAFAISSCAVFHRSPLFADRAVNTHDLLRNATVCASSNMQRLLVVSQGAVEYTVASNQVSLNIEMSPESLTVTLPQSRKAQKLCQRSEFAKELVKHLNLTSSSAMTQIHRILNELDIGTDDILEQERVPPADWLVKTQRLATASPPASPTVAPMLTPPRSQPSSSPYVVPADLDTLEYEDVLVSTTSGQISYRIPSRPVYVPIPTVVNHIVEAPEYKAVLDHVLRQATGVKWRRTPEERTQTSTYESMRTIATASTSQLFGKDAFVYHRIGAAGELFVFEILRSLFGDKVSLQNWPSSIRHFVRALGTHDTYGQITQWSGRETSDLVYEDKDCELPSDLQRLRLGDTFEEWFPDWILETSEPLEWFFDVKSTVGSCNSPFFLSQSQYSRMRKAGRAENELRRQVYCIVRVYDLLSDKIGIKLFIDPWRFRDWKLTFDTTDKWRVTTS